MEDKAFRPHLKDEFFDCTEQDIDYCSNRITVSEPITAISFLGSNGLTGIAITDAEGVKQLC